MKDLPHHIKKLNRQVIRSIHRMEMEEETYDLNLPSPPEWPKGAKQRKKQAKAKIRKERMSRTPSPPTPEERNKQMSHRGAAFDRINHPKPPTAKPTKKKPPRI